MAQNNGTNFFPTNGLVRVALTDEFGDAMLAECLAANIPSAVAGYAVGCEIIATDTGAHYFNLGTTASCTFTAVATGTGSLTLPTTATDASTTTGDSLALTFSALTTGGGLRLTANALTSGQALVIDSSSNSLTGSGALLRVNHTGTSTADTSAAIAKIRSAATENTTIVSIDATAALAGGKILNISGGSVTTGTLLDISDNTSHTTGTAVNIVTNSANTGTRTLLNVKQDHASATGTTVAAFTQDAPTSTNYFKIATFNGFTLWAGNGTTPNGNLSGTAGDWLIGGDSGKGYFCTGTTNWTAFA